LIAPNNFDLIVFDWDGTLSDSTGLIAACIQRAARELEFREPTVEEAKQIIGLGLMQSTATLFPELSPPDRMRFAERFRHHYVPRDHEAALYAGAKTLLEQLAHPARFLAVATGKPRAGLERAFQYTDIKSHFHATRCGDEGFPKPHPGMLEHIMDALGVEPARTLMIGDTTHDLELAANARTHAVAITHGAHSRDALARGNARTIVESLPELQRWLQQNA
jgi:phosphoglycolate phosphatase